MDIEFYDLVRRWSWYTFYDPSADLIRILLHSDIRKVAWSYEYDPRAELQAGAEIMAIVDESQFVYFPHGTIVDEPLNPGIWDDPDDDPDDYRFPSVALQR